MFTVGPRIMSRPSAFTSCATTRAPRATSSGSQLDAMAMPAGNAVVNTCGVDAAFVTAEDPRQLRTPSGHPPS